MIELPLISVVVPVYNVEPYLERCIKSLLAQSYNRLEIILVDDGSTDNSGKICDEFEKNDSRIVVIHKENGGLSDARNIALANMKGKYVTCVDSDDFVSPFYIENLYIAISKDDCDIACSWFLDYFEGDNLPVPYKINDSDILIVERIDFYQKLLYQDGVETSAWGKLYRSVLFDDVRYPKGKLYEDIPTIYNLTEKVNKIAIISKVDYFYYQRSDSIAQANFSIRKMDAIVHMNEFKNNIILNYPILENAARCRYMSALCNIIFQIPEREYREQHQFLWIEIKKNRKYILKDKKSRKKARVAALISYGGYSFMKLVYLNTGKQKRFRR